MEKYSSELKAKVVKLHLSEGRSMSSLEREYNISKGSVSNWIKLYNKECQNDAGKKGEQEYFSQLLDLKKENDELKKENLFLKKATAFFAKEM